MSSLEETRFCSFVPERLRHELRTIATLDAFRALRRQWEALAAGVTDLPASMAYSYGELAAGAVLARAGAVVVVTVRDGVDLRAIWPFEIHRRGLLRIAQPLSCGMYEEYGAPLVADDADDAVLATAVAAARQLPADLLEIPFVEDGRPLHRLLERMPRSWIERMLPTQVGRLPSYSIALRGFAHWNDFAAGLTTTLRSKLRYNHKRLSARGVVQIGWCTTIDDAASTLTWLFANKRRWAASRRLTAHYLLDDRARDFFIDLARRTDLAATPLVVFVKLDNQPIAASVNLVGRRSLEYLITTYDEAFGNYSPGNLLIDFLVRWSQVNGRDFDFRPFHADYKARWANRQTFRRTHWLFLSVRGRLGEAMLLASLADRLMRRLREFRSHVIEAGRRRFNCQSASRM